MKLILGKLKESATSIIPIVAIVYILSLTPFFSVSTNEKIVFLVSAVVLIVGMTLFNIGAELSMTPMGDYAGTGLIKTKNLLLILGVAFFMGLLVTIAEPDLTVLANQVEDAIDPNTLIFSVGIGVGVFLLIGLLKVIFNEKLSILLLLFYMFINFYL